jgi:hypothetical protein
MKTSSLNRVHQELHAAWQRGEPVELRRIGDRKFVVGEPVGSDGEFVFNTGFTDGPARLPEAEMKPNSRRNERGRHRLDNRPAHTTGEPKTKGLKPATIALICLAVAGVVSWKGYAVYSAVNRIASISVVAKQPALTKAQVMAQLPASTRKIYAKELKDCLSFVPPVPLEKGFKTFEVKRDITIGGERQQTIFLNCGIEGRTITVRYSYAQGTWKVKSATQGGSRSLLSTY